MTEPILRVGLAQRRTSAQITLQGAYRHGDRELSAGTQLEVRHEPGLVVLDDQSGAEVARGAAVELTPVDAEVGFVLHAMTVGVDFHWQHEQDLQFVGTVSVESRGAHFDVVNGVPLERYLESVVSSEMSATCPTSLLQAHAVISRSWLLAQLEGAKEPDAPPPGVTPIEGGHRVVRWYDREDHQHFDVCADDHCQRYQGVTRSFTPEALDAVRSTKGLVLTDQGKVCDARFSKACGGMTEVFEAAWADTPVAYLQAFPDAPAARWDLPLTDEAHAVTFIEGAPPAYCNTTDQALLGRILPALDHATTSFYRWETVVTAAQVQAWVHQKLEIDVGTVVALEPLERGPSGRLTRLAIVGDQRVEVGKELEIRRVLSDSHLYSSAFVVHAEEGTEGPQFRLRGAGWGHGVGLCQIGAAVMADQGFDHTQILAHYFRGAELSPAY